MNDPKDKVKILRAEDDIDVATNISVTLEALGYEVIKVVDTG